ncbi:MAG: DUF4905 domain-containing protein [Runella slithyformis]|nr:MAG: DUF4905 domain-containing protein [Runella slithyformis]
MSVFFGGSDGSHEARRAATHHADLNFCQFNNLFCVILGQIYSVLTVIHSQSFSFNLPVWRIMGNILADASVPTLLVLELRNRDQVAWANLNLSTGRLIWQHTIETTDWWTGSLGCYNGILLLHRYANAEQPAPTGLLAVNADDGKVRWELKKAVFVQTDGHFMQIAQRNAAQEPAYEWRQLTDAQPIVEPPQNWIAPNQDSTWLTSISYAPTNQYYDFLSHFIANKTGQQPVQIINYAEIDGCIVLLYYFYSPNSITLSQSLLVIDSTKKILWHEISSNLGDSTTLGGFMHNQNQVIYRRSELELLVLNFSKS